MHLDPPPQPRRIGDKEVVAHQLHRGTQAGGEAAPALPVIFGEPVFERDDRIRPAQTGVVVEQLRGLTLRSFTREAVRSILVQVAGGDVDGNGHIGTGTVSGLADRVHQHVEGFFSRPELGGKSTFVADGGTELPPAQDAAQRVERLHSHPQRVGKADSPDGGQHELLHVQWVVGVQTPVDDVHQRDRQGVRLAAQEAVEWNMLRCRGGSGHREGDAQQGVGAQRGLVGSPVERT